MPQRLLDQGRNGISPVPSTFVCIATTSGSGEVRLRRLVKEAMRMRPDRIIVGEVRQEECLDLLIALNSGLPGMCSIHANSAREAVVKMCTLPLLAGENVSHSFVVPTVASSIDLVVHLQTDDEGRRRVREIVGVPGRVEGDIVETATILNTVDNDLTRAEGYPPHPERFARAGFDLPRLLAEPAYRPPTRSRGRSAADSDGAGAALLRRARALGTPPLPVPHRSHTSPGRAADAE